MLNSGYLHQLKCIHTLGLLCILVQGGLLYAQDILVLRPNEKNFKMALDGLTEQLDDELSNPSLPF